MTREEAVKQVDGRVRSLMETRQFHPQSGHGSLYEQIVKAVDASYPRSNYGKTDYRFGPADVLEMEREMRRRLRI